MPKIKGLVILGIILIGVILITGCTEPTKYNPCCPQQPPCGTKTSVITIVDFSTLLSNAIAKDSDGILYLIAWDGSVVPTWHISDSHKVEFQYKLDGQNYRITKIIHNFDDDCQCCPSPCCTPVPTPTCIKPTPTPACGCER